MEKLEGVIFYMIDKAIKSYRQFAQKSLNAAKLGITVDQWLIMNMISENPEMSQLEIAEKVFKDNASVTRIIELLVEKGYVKREISLSDRRRSNLGITVKGRNLLSRAEKTVRAYRKKALRNISEKELGIMNATLVKITANTGKRTV